MAHLYRSILLQVWLHVTGIKVPIFVQFNYLRRLYIGGAWHRTLSMLCDLPTALLAPEPKHESHACADCFATLKVVAVCCILCTRPVISIAGCEASAANI